MPIKLVLFDFDQTLAATHVYYMLDQHIDDNSEDATDFSQKQLEIWRRMYGKEKDLNEVFGSAERRGKVRGFLKGLKGLGARLVIITHGFQKVVETVVEEAGLSYFDDVIGCDTGVAVKLLCDKTAVVKHLMETHKLTPQECLLVDDDYRNLTGNVTPTLWVWGRQGITDDQMQRVTEGVAGVSGGSGWYSPDKCLPLPDFEQFAQDYLVMKNVADVTSAVKKCNSVPFHMRFEPLKIIRTHVQGRPTHTLLYPTPAHLTEYLQISSRYTPSYVPKAPVYPTHLKFTSKRQKTALSEVKDVTCLSAVGSRDIEALVESVSQDPTLEVTGTHTGVTVKRDGSGSTPTIYMTVRRKGE